MTQFIVDYCLAVPTKLRYEQQLLIATIDTPCASGCIVMNIKDIDIRFIQHQLGYMSSSHVSTNNVIARITPRNTIMFWLLTVLSVIRTRKR
jgi:hypothetical protein